MLGILVLRKYKTLAEEIILQIIKLYNQCGFWTNFFFIISNTYQNAKFVGKIKIWKSMTK